jgi:hypothetical protein
MISKPNNKESFTVYLKATNQSLQEKKLFSVILKDIQ